MIPDFPEQSSIFIQTVREAPSGPHVDSLGKQVTTQRYPLLKCAVGFHGVGNLGM